MSQSNLSRHESNHLALDERLKKLFTRGFEYNNLASRAFQKLTQLFQSSWTSNGKIYRRFQKFNLVSERVIFFDRVATFVDRKSDIFELLESVL